MNRQVWEILRDHFTRVMRPGWADNGSSLMQCKYCPFQVTLPYDGLRRPDKALAEAQAKAHITKQHAEQEAKYASQ